MVHLLKLKYTVEYFLKWENNKKQFVISKNSVKNNFDKHLFFTIVLIILSSYI